jgi:carbon-monoxide dehydrogenase large subunit
VLATVGPPPAVVNSVVDAPSPFGVVHADMPLNPAAVWLAIQAASGDGQSPAGR